WSDPGAPALLAGPVGAAPVALPARLAGGGARGLGWLSAAPASSVSAALASPNCPACIAQRMPKMAVADQRMKIAVVLFMDRPLTPGLPGAGSPMHRSSAGQGRARSGTGLVSRAAERFGPGFRMHAPLDRRGSPLLEPSS